MKVEMLSVGTDNTHGFQLIPETQFEAHWLEKFVASRGQQHFDPEDKTNHKSLSQGVWFPEGNDRDIKNLDSFRVSIS